MTEEISNEEAARLWREAQTRTLFKWNEDAQVAINAGREPPPIPLDADGKLKPTFEE